MPNFGLSNKFQKKMQRQLLKKGTKTYSILKLKCPKCDYSIESKDLRIFNRKVSKKGELHGQI